MTSDENPDAADGRSSPPPARPCPICGKPRDEQMRPFCSRRCADVDLHRWLGGVYAIAASDSDERPDVEANEDTP